MKWSGRTHKTLIMDVDNPLEWDMLITGHKEEIRSPKPLIGTEIEAPTMVMIHHGGRYAPFFLTESWQEELHEVDDDDAKAEGFDSLASFKRHWSNKTGSTHFSMMSRVWGYHLIPFLSPDEIENGISVVLGLEYNCVKAITSIICDLYPSDMS